MLNSATCLGDHDTAVATSIALGQHLVKQKSGVVGLQCAVRAVCWCSCSCGRLLCCTR